MAKAKSPTGAADSNSNRKPSSSPHTIVPPIVSFVVIALIAALILAVLIPKRQGTDLERQTKQYANHQLALLSQSISSLKTHLDLIASRSDIRQTVMQNETAALQRKNAELSAAFPQADSVLLLPLDSRGITGLRKHNISLRNNIESSLVNRAEDNETTFPEAYRFGNGMQFSLVSPVFESDGMEVGGAILLRMDITKLQAALSNLDSTLGETQLLQKFRGQEQVLLSTGSNASAELAPHDAQLDDSNWWVRFKPSESVREAIAMPVWSLLFLLILPAVLVPLWHFWSLRRIGIEFYAQLDGLAGYAQSLISGNRRMPPVFAHQKLNQLAELIGAFRNHSPEQKQAQAESKSAATAKTTAGDKKQTAAQPVPAEAAEPEVTKAEDLLEEPPQVDVPDCIFRAYDIRGDAEKYLTDDTVYALGMAIGSEAMERGQEQIVVSADGRLSSPRIKQALCAGLQACGQHVLDIGEQPTPLLYFATHHLETGAGIMITGSHNGVECNGLKLVMDGKPLAGEHIQTIRERVKEGRFQFGHGKLEKCSVADAYIEAIVGDIAVAQELKVVVDAANGIGGIIGPRVLEELGCEVIPLHCEVDGNFPNHGPDPTISENLNDLRAAVTANQADLGIALDGDADRVCVVDASGKPIAPDVLLMLFAQDVVSRNPGADIIYDVKCTRHLSTVISSYGGRPIMWKSGHSCIKEKMLQTGALLGGEFTGHICFKERWYGFDDGIYSAARLIEIVSTSGLTLNELLQEYPSSTSTPEIIIDTGEQQKFEIVEALTDNAQFGGGKITTLDGIRVDYPDGWGLIRPSNTVPAITLRFEADNDEALSRIQSVFRDQIGLVNPTLASAF